MAKLYAEIVHKTKNQKKSDDAEPASQIGEQKTILETEFRQIETVLIEMGL